MKIRGIVCCPKMQRISFFFTTICR
nr:unnamed protein product [Callosobruchus chinensis]